MAKEIVLTSMHSKCASQFRMYSFKIKKLFSFVSITGKKIEVKNLSTVFVLYFAFDHELCLARFRTRIWDYYYLFSWAVWPVH